MKKPGIVLLALAVSLGATAQRPARRSPLTAHAVSLRPRAAATTTPTVNTSIVTTWSYTPTPGVPQCVGSGTPTSCYNGFQMQITQPDSTVVGLTIAPTATSNTWTPPLGLEYGTFTVAMWTTGYDQNGNPITSSTVTTTAMNALTSLNPPTGLTAAVQ